MSSLSQPTPHGNVKGASLLDSELILHCKRKYSGDVELHNSVYYRATGANIRDALDFDISSLWQSRHANASPSRHLVLVEELGFGFN